MKLYNVHSIEEVRKQIAENKFCLLYISRESCSVCHALLPQIEQVLEKYPSVVAFHVDADEMPEVAGQFSIFTVPAILVFVEGKEMIRKARFVPVEVFESELSRLISLVEE